MLPAQCEPIGPTHVYLPMHAATPSEAIKQSSGCRAMVRSAWCADAGRSTSGAEKTAANASA